MPKSIDYKDLYNAINELRLENNAGQEKIANKLELFLKDEYFPLKGKVEKIWIYGSIAVGIASILANYTIGWVTKALAGV